MRVICTTVTRPSGRGAPHGYIYDIDWDTRKILKSLPVIAPKTSSGFFGNAGFRAAGGVRVGDDGIYVAMSDRIVKYDSCWKELGDITNPLFRELHELVVEKDGIWVASTGLDLAVKVDFSGRTMKCWSPRTCVPIKQIYGIEDQYNGAWPPPSARRLSSAINQLTAGFLRLVGRSSQSRSGAPYHVLNTKPDSIVESWLWWAYRRFPALSPDDFHLNCVYRFGDELYATIFKWPWVEKACLVRMEPDLATELGCPGLSRVHNGQIIDDHRLIINDTGGKAVKVFERQTNRLISAIPASAMGVEGPAWLRGLKQLSCERVLIGIGADSSVRGSHEASAPVSTQIVEMELTTGKVLNRVILSNDPSSSVHGLDAIE